MNLLKKTMINLNQLLRSSNNYYQLAELNECLFLNHKGITIIQDLEPFTGLRSLFLQGNKITVIQGLSELKQIRNLYLQDNLIEKIEGLECLQTLISLNLSNNYISVIEKYIPFKKNVFYLVLMSAYSRC